MRTLVILVALAVTFFTAACSTIDDMSVAPSTTEVKAAQAFLQTRDPKDSNIGDAVWERGIVLRTHFVDNNWTKSWSMVVLKPDGSTQDIRNSLSAITTTLRDSVLVGDYVAYNAGSDGTINETEIKTLKKVAVDIKGR